MLVIEKKWLSWVVLSALVVIVVVLLGFFNNLRIWAAEELVVQDHRVTVTAGHGVEFSLGDWIVGSQLVVSLVDQPQFGQAQLSGNILSYQATPGFFGEDRFDYQVCLNGLCSQAEIWIIVSRPLILTAPLIEVETVNTRDLIIAIRDEVVSANAHLSQQALTLSPLLPESHGGARISILPNERIVYEPVVDFVGSDSFNYEICDGQGCDINTVKINVVQGNSAPRLENDVCEANSGVSVLCDVLANDLDEDFGLDVGSLSLYEAPNYGQAWVEDGMIGYLTNSSSRLEDVLSYQVCDQLGECRRAWLTIVVKPVVASEVEAEPFVPVPAERLEVIVDQDEYLLEDQKQIVEDSWPVESPEPEVFFEEEIESEIIPVLVIQDDPIVPLEMNEDDFDLPMSLVLMSLMGGLGVVLIPLFFYLTTNPMGMMIGGRDLTVAERVAIVRDLGGSYYKPDTVSLDNWWIQD